jgi:integrase
MASLQLRAKSWSCIFCYKGKRHWLPLGEMPEIDAVAKRTRVEYLLRLIKQRLLAVPPGLGIVQFMEQDGHTVDEPAPAKEVVTFASLRDSYLRVHSNGTLEKTTLDGIEQHFKHWMETLGEDFPMQRLVLSDLQGHIDRRCRMKGMRGNLVSPATMKKEIVTLRTVWNWAVQFGLVTGKFPMKGLRFPRGEEKLPFMTWEEVERQIAAGGHPNDLWECLYLRTQEIGELLQYVETHAVHRWVYPFFCFAAYTGARRSEMMRALISDVDLAANTVTIREKKRVRGKDSARRVPLTPLLKQALTDWLAHHPGGPHLFCHGAELARSKKRSKLTGYKGGKNRPKSLKKRMQNVRERESRTITALTRNEVRDHWERTLAGSKWSVLRGPHTLRHSFISACASRGVDQRLIDEWVGHTTDEMRKRYRHLWPSTQLEAITNVFHHSHGTTLSSAAPGRN